jgi:hypothetical protein
MDNVVRHPYSASNKDDGLDKGIVYPRGQLDGRCLCLWKSKTRRTSTYSLEQMCASFVLRCCFWLLFLTKFPGMQTKSIKATTPTRKTRPANTPPSTIAPDLSFGRRGPRAMTAAKPRVDKDKKQSMPLVGILVDREWKSRILARTVMENSRGMVTTICDCAQTDIRSYGVVAFTFRLMETQNYKHVQLSACGQLVRI